MVGKKILVTGSSGFIGSALVRKLKKMNLDVDGLDIVAQDTTNILVDLNEFEKADKYDIIFHMAAMTEIDSCELKPKKAYQINVNGTMKLIDNFTGELFVYIQTIGVYSPISTYAKTKKIAGEYIINSKKPYIIFVLSGNVYGIGSKSVVWKFFINKEKGIEIFGDGSQIRDFVYIDDFIEILCSCPNLEKNRTYHIGTGRYIKISKLAKIIGCKKISYAERKKYDIIKPKFIEDIKCPTTLEQGLALMEKLMSI